MDDFFLFSKIKEISKNKSFYLHSDKFLTLLINKYSKVIFHCRFFLFEYRKHLIIMGVRNLLVTWMFNA